MSMDGAGVVSKALHELLPPPHPFHNPPFRIPKARSSRAGGWSGIPVLISDSCRWRISQAPLLIPSNLPVRRCRCVPRAVSQFVSFRSAVETFASCPSIHEHDACAKQNAMPTSS